MKLRGLIAGPIAALLCVHCLPDFDKLSSKYGERPPTESSRGAGGSSGSGQGQIGALTGGYMNGGRSGSSGKGGSGAKGGKGGSSTGAKGGTGTGATGGGETQAGQGGEGGEAGVGQSGAPQGGTSGLTSGGSSNGGTPGGEAGAGGAGPGLPCSDGCVLFYVPPSANFQQFFTINLDLTNGFDLSDSVFTAHLRAIDFTGTGDTIQFYASAANYAFWNNNGVSVPISTLSGGGTLTMDLTSTPGWDSTHTISFGFLLRGAATATTVQVLVEDITVAVKADPQATPKVGPWLFTHASDVNGARAETIDTMYSTPNVIFANPYNAVTGAKAVWVPAGP